jgi:tetratricopeptide (TPR) repeat protein
VQEQLVRIDLGENDLDAAIKDGENSLSFFPNQAWMNYMVGVAWQQKRDYNKAVSYLRTATVLETQDKELLSQSFSALGDCYHSLGDNKNSDSAYEKAIAINPDNAFTLNNYAYYLSLRNERLESAAQMSKHSNDLQANTASFEDTYAWILFKQKKYAEAKLWIEKSLLHDKGSSAVKTEHYGDILFFLGDTDGALQNWTKAKTQGGKSPVLERKINEKKYLNKIVIVFCLLALVACKSKKLVVVNRPTTTVDSAAINKENSIRSRLAAIQSKQVTFNTFSGKAKTKLDINGNSNDVTLNIRVARDQKIWISVTAIIGIEVARAQITPDSIIVVNRLQSVYLKKPFSYVYTYASRQINFKTLQALLVGNAIPEVLNPRPDFAAEGNNTVLSGTLQDLVYKLLLGPDMKVTQTNLSNQFGGKSLQVANNVFIQAA